MGDKMAPKYFGPYTVIEVIGKGVYRLADEKGPMKQTVNSSNLKQWHDKADDTDKHGTDYNQEKDKKENKKKENNDKQGIQQNNQNVSDNKAQVTRSTKFKTTTTNSNIQDLTTTIDLTEMGQLDDTPAPSETSLWVQQLNLKLSDRALLRNGDWLNDRLLDAVNNLVASHIGSEVNQSVLVCQSAAGFDAVQTETVMIIHDQNHWIATAVLRGQVYVMDSLRR